MTQRAIARDLKLVSSRHETTSPSALRLQLAFASSDQHTVDQHFGSALNFAIYEVTPDDLHLRRVISFTAEAQDGNEAKLADRIEALIGCNAVFCCAVGASAIAQLTSRGVQPLKAPNGTAIKAQIAIVQDEMRNEPAPWMRRAFEGKKSATRFNDMEEDGWSE